LQVYETVCDIQIITERTLCHAYDVITDRRIGVSAWKND